MDEHARLSHITDEHDLFSCPITSECQLTFETHELLLDHLGNLFFNFSYIFIIYLNLLYIYYLAKSHDWAFCNLCARYVDNNMIPHLRSHGIESLENFSKNIFVIQVNIKRQTFSITFLYNFTIK